MSRIYDKSSDHKPFQYLYFSLSLQTFFPSNVQTQVLRHCTYLISVSLNIGGKPTRTPPLSDPQHTSPLFPATQVAEEEAGDDAGDEDGNQRAFTDALDASDLHIGETDGERHEDPIVCDLDLAEVQVIGVGNGIDEALSRKLQHVCDSLKCHPQRNHGRTE